MADNLALKLLVAGIIGAVVGAAAAERYHFPTGLVYGGFNRPPATTYTTRPAIDPNLGSGSVPTVPDDDRYHYDPYRYDRYRYDSYRYEWREEPPPRYYYRPPPKPRAPARTAMCWREFEDWNFGTVGHYVPCRPRVRRSDERG